MRAVTRLFGVVAAGALIAGSAGAQACTGLSSLDKAHVNVGANAWFGDNWSSFGGQLSMRHVGFGQNHFITVNVNSEKASGASSSSLSFGGTLGLEEKTKDGIEWCPKVNVDYTKYPNSVGHGLDIGAGIGVAKAMSSMGSFSLVPFGSASFIRVSTTIDNCGLSDCSVSNTGLAFGAGVGFRFNNGMQLSPQFMATTISGSKTTYGATFSIPLGMGM